MATTSDSKLEEQLRAAEQDIEVKSAQMGRLKAEYTVNVNNLKSAYFPKSLPYTAAVYQSRVYQQELATRIYWSEAMVVAMEKLKGSFIEGRDMAAVKQQMFDALTPDLEEVFQLMEGLSKDELAVLRSYDNPPQAVLDTIFTVMTIRGETELSWEGSKVLFSETYYYTFFISKARGRHRYGEFTKEQADAMAAYVMAPELEHATVSLVSRPCGVFSRWIAVLYQYYLLTVITAPSPPGKVMNVAVAKEELAKLRQEVQQKKQDIVGAEVTLQALGDELHQRLSDLRVKYDDTMIPLQEMFFESNRKFNETYAIPRKERDARRAAAGGDVYDE
eukprot:GILI01018461.1.p1 GENE.GILI01018461.1~~GILI01018461.1.p1  ORF type:complete len:333 (-),score=76.96 GILI01018461.1:182-1180(-)